MRVKTFDALTIMQDAIKKANKTATLLEKLAHNYASKVTPEQSGLASELAGKAFEARATVVYMLEHYLQIVGLIALPARDGDDSLN